MSACGAPTATVLPPAPASDSLPAAQPAQPESKASPAPAASSASGDGCDGTAAESQAVTDAAKDTAEQLRFYSWEPANYAYHLVPLPKKDIPALVAELAACQPLANTKAEENPVNPLGYLAVLGDGTKQEYFLTETQLWNKDNAVLNLPAPRCKELYDLAASSNTTGAGFPQWLAYLNEHRVTKAAFVGNDLNANIPLDFTTTDPQQLLDFARMLQQDVSCKRKQVCTKTEGKNVPAASPDQWHFSLTFDSGVVYDVYLDGDSNLTVLSSDIDYTLGYQSLVNNDIIHTVQRISSEVNGTPSLVVKNPETAKPVIYLYPTQTTEVSVKLDFAGQLCYTYPAYRDGWEVTADPDGHLVNKEDGSEHYYLFWDGSSGTDWQFDSGFCVAGADTEAFLKEKLPLLGLTPREYNDFITFWVPRLQSNPYNLITFAGAQYEALAPLTVTPAPDSILRVHMVYKPLTQYQDIPPQPLTGFTRKGFSLVEWGGSLAK